MANFNQTEVFQGLGTLAIGVPDAATYNVDVKSTIPTLINGGGVSALVIVIKVNATTKYTGSAGNMGAWAQVTCSAGDTINVVFSSSNAVDSALNAVKSVVAVSEGPGY